MFLVSILEMAHHKLSINSCIRYFFGPSYSILSVYGVKKVRRHYLNIHCQLNNVTIFTKLHKCDIENINKALQHINSSFKMTRKSRTAVDTPSPGLTTKETKILICFEFDIYRACFLKLVQLIKMQKH